MTDIDTIWKIVKEIGNVGAGAMIFGIVLFMFNYLRNQSNVLQQAMKALAEAQDNRSEINDLKTNSATMTKTLQDVSAVIPASIQAMTDLHQLIITFTGKQEAVLTENQNQTTALAALAQDQEAALNGLGVKMNEIQTDVQDGNAQVIAELVQIKEALRDMIEMLRPLLETLDRTASKITQEQPEVTPGVTIETKQSESEEKKS